MKQQLSQKSSQLVSAISVKKNDNANNGFQIEYRKGESGGYEQKPACFIDKEEEAEFQREYQEYQQIRMQRKYEVEQHKRDRYETSSSEEEEFTVSKSHSSNSEVPNTPCQLTKTASQPVKLTEKKQQPQSSQISAFVSSKVGKEEWTPSTVGIEISRIRISPAEYQFKSLNKVKAYQGTVLNNCQRLKLTVGNQEIILAVQDSLSEGLSTQYVLLADLVAKKLEQLCVHPDKALKVKAPPGIPQSLKDISLLCGKIWKKSQILGIWEERVGVVTQKGLSFCKDITDKPANFIAHQTMKELWTRFELIHGHLIVKVSHGITKTQLGIPLEDYMTTNCWLYHLHRLVKTA